MTDRHFETIGLIGAGLIGGSIAARLALIMPETGLRIHDMSPGNAAYVAERHPKGAVVRDMADLATCDLIFVATPVSAIARQVLALLALPDSEAVIIDTGSTKKAIIDEVETGTVDSGRFVPGHPLAGGIAAGPGGSRANILAARPFILTPPDRTDANALGTARTLLTELGIDIVEMDAADHDRLLAIGSHLPHLVAAALAGMGGDAPAPILPASYRAIAAFAGSDPQMWTDIFRANRDELKAAAEEFKKRLDLIVTMADEPGPGILLETLNSAKDRADALENEE